MNHIELFAGCGGLSLGLETAGFDLLLANELSPMAAETFAHNHLGADLDKQKNIDKIFWISSEHSREDIKARLKENPYNATGLGKKHHSDLLDQKPNHDQLRRSLLIGSIVDLNTIINQDKNHALLESLESGLNGDGIDLISGGPPCQSFSLAGMRDHTHHRNQLPGAFSQFVGKVKPKLVLLENVSGILRAFDIDGKKFHAWFEVAKAFAKEEYVPLCLHINAKYTGTAQNRPRFIMLALREDIYIDLKNNSNEDDLLISALKHGAELLEPMREIKAIEEQTISEKKKSAKISTIDPQVTALPYFDIENEDHLSLFKETQLSPLLSRWDGKDPTTSLTGVEDALHDLHSKNRKQSDYVQHINSVYINPHNHELNKNNNHEPRSNGPKVKSRFRIYQRLSKMEDTNAAKEISHYLKSGDKNISLSDNALALLAEDWLLDYIEDEKTGEDINIELPKPKKEDIPLLLNKLFTKKQTQKALVKGQPAPAALSIPDDACHYHESFECQRTLTVREMTRIQSFPDWYEIKSKVTTGGQLRKFEVPQYTQIGNAVPPLLGLALGEVCKSILEDSGNG